MFTRSATIPWRTRVFLAAALVILGIQPLAGQEGSGSPAPPPSIAVFRRTVRRVIVDVVVTDSLGKPVQGLAGQDFSVFENGRPQPILSFDVHDFNSPPSASLKLPPLPPNTFVNVPTTPERGPLYVLLLDLVNTQMDDQMYARQQLLQFISSKPAGTRFAVFVLSDLLRLVQGFTDNRDQLFAAVDPKKPKAHFPRVFLFGANYGRGNTDVMIQVFTFISHYLEGLPGRKNLIWMAGGFPVSLFARDDDPPDLRDEIMRAIDTMARAQVALYPVDVRGVMIDNPRAAKNSASPFLLAADYASEDSIAGLTGGQAVYSNNDLKGALAAATEAGADYYTISYSPSDQNYDGSLRKIKVGVAGHGYHLAYRQSYYAEDPETPPHGQPVEAQDPAEQEALDQTPEALAAEMRPGAPMGREVFFSAHIHPVGAAALGTSAQMAYLATQPTYFTRRRKNKPATPLQPILLQPYLIDYVVPTRQFKPQASSGPSATLEFAAAVFDADGKMLTSIVQKMDNAPATEPTNVPRTVYHAEQRIEVPLKAISIRVAVREVSTDLIGALEVPLPLAPERVSKVAAPTAPGGPASSSGTSAAPNPN